MYFINSIFSSNTLLSLIISIILVISLYIFILPDTKRSSLNKGFLAIHDFLKIKRLMVESIFRFLYVFFVVSSIVSGFLLLFKSFGRGLTLMILGPIICRIIFELLLMSILLVKNVMEINNHLKGIDEPSTDSNFTAEVIFSKVGRKIQDITTTTNSSTENPNTCSKCGKPIPEDGIFCVHCGTKTTE